MKTPASSSVSKVFGDFSFEKVTARDCLKAVGIALALIAAVSLIYAGVKTGFFASCKAWIIAHPYLAAGIGCCTLAATFGGLRLVFRDPSETDETTSDFIQAQTQHSSSQSTSSKQSSIAKTKINPREIQTLTVVHVQEMDNTERVDELKRQRLILVELQKKKEEKDSPSRIDALRRIEELKLLSEVDSQAFSELEEDAQEGFAKQYFTDCCVLWDELLVESISEKNRNNDLDYFEIRKCAHQATEKYLAMAQYASAKGDSDNPKSTGHTPKELALLIAIGEKECDLGASEAAEILDAYKECLEHIYRTSREFHNLSTLSNVFTVAVHRFYKLQEIAIGKTFQERVVELEKMHPKEKLQYLQNLDENLKKENYRYFTAKDKIVFLRALGFVDKGAFDEMKSSDQEAFLSAYLLYLDKLKRMEEDLSNLMLYDDLLGDDSVSTLYKASVEIFFQLKGFEKRIEELKAIPLPEWIKFNKNRRENNRKEGIEHMYADANKILPYLAALGTIDHEAFKKQNEETRKEVLYLYSSSVQSYYSELVYLFDPDSKERSQVENQQEQAKREYEALLKIHSTVDLQPLLAKLADLQRLDTYLKELGYADSNFLTKCEVLEQFVKVDVEAVKTMEFKDKRAFFYAYAKYLKLCTSLQERALNFCKNDTVNGRILILNLEATQTNAALEKIKNESLDQAYEDLFETKNTNNK